MLVRDILRDSGLIRSPSVRRESHSKVLISRNGSDIRTSKGKKYSDGYSGYYDGHSGYSNDHSGYNYGGYDTIHKSECCEQVIDNYSFLALMIFIGLATYFLQVAITMNLGRRKKRSAAKSGMQNNLLDIIINSGMKLFFFWS